MEPLATKSSLPHKRFIIIIGAFLILIAGALIILYLLFNRGYFASLAFVQETATRKIEKVKVIAFNAESEPYTGYSNFKLNTPVKPLKRGECFLPHKIIDPHLKSDTNSLLSQLQYPDPQAKPEDCKTAYRFMVLKRTPEFITSYVNKPEEIKEWIQSNSEFKNVVNSELGNSFFSEIKDITKIQSNNSDISSLKDSFLLDIFFDTLQADAEFYGDFSHGIGGIIYSFNANKAKVSTSTIISLLKIIADKGYSIPHISSPLWRFSFVGRTFFIGEYRKRIFLGFDLPGLINAIDNEGSQNPPPSLSTVTVAINPSAYLSQRFTNALNDKLGFTTFLGLNLTKTNMQISSLSTTPTKIYSSLSPSLAEGIANTISSEVFFSLALSYIPTEVLKEKFWQYFSSPNALFPAATHKAGGFALVWDIISEGNKNNISDIAYLFSDDSANPLELKQSVLNFVSPNSNIRYCPATKTWISASSQLLLAKLMNTCTTNVPAVATLISNKNIISQNQALLFINPQVALREAFLAGGIKTKIDSKNGIETGDDASLEEAKTKIWASLEGELNKFTKTILLGSVDKNMELHLQRME